MKTITLSLILLGAMLPSLLLAVPAQAQRVFVSATGLDRNPCTFASPCHSFQHAHDVAPANGEIDVLDPAGYGSLTINKGISIQGHGFSGISVASGGTGIMINAPATAAVHLNGLLIDGSGVGASGIVFLNGAALTVENSVVRDLTQFGIQFTSTVETAETLSVSNSYFTDIFGTGVQIRAQSSGQILGTIDRTALYGSGPRNGVFAGAGVSVSGVSGSLSVTVTDSVAAYFNQGFSIFSSGAFANLSVTHCLSNDNSQGLRASGSNATLWVAQSTVTGNIDNVFDADTGGVINSYGDNYMRAANGLNSGSLTSVTKQ